MGKELKKFMFVVGCSLMVLLIAAIIIFIKHK
jgi:hypothetical protein